MRSFLFLCFSFLISINNFAQPSPFIHVDQFGYVLNQDKVAVLSDPEEGYNAAFSYTPPTMLEIREAATDEVVFTGAIEEWNDGAVQTISGDRGWLFDFSANYSARNIIFDSAGDALYNNYNNIFYPNQLDLYQAYVPEWSYYWGSNRVKAQFANLNLLMLHLTAQSSLHRKASLQLHYFHGVNPLGVVYLSNMYDYGGERCINEIYHTWFYDGTEYDNALTSPKGPAPGYLVGGPNEYYSVPSQSPPYGQPALKSYLDFNDGWPLNSWEVSEPSITYQAAYIRLLSRFVNLNINTSISTIKHHEAMSIAPNPGNGAFQLRGFDGSVDVQVYDLSGKVVFAQERVASGEAVYLPETQKGVYMVQLFTATGKPMGVLKYVRL